MDYHKAYEYYKKAFGTLNAMEEYDDISEYRKEAEKGRDHCFEYLRYV